MSKFVVLNPFDNSIYGEFEYSTQVEVDISFSLLKKGKEIQKNLSAFERSDILNKLGHLFLKHEMSLAEMITNEMGKTINDSLVEIQRSANTAFCAANECQNSHGEVLDSDSYGPKRGKIGIVRKKPIGTVLAITPFNFPINLSMHKIGPAFAAGNVIFFKPGPQNYFSGKRLVELCYEAGIPKEVIQFSCPDIPVLSNIIKSDLVNCISFTGGTKTAKIIAQNAGLKKLLFELGGNDPLIVMPDADLDLATTTAINQRFATAGQRCTASKRLFIHADIYERFKTLLVAKSEKLIIGNPLSKDTFVGPVVNSAAADLVENRINSAIKEGAKLLLGGKRVGNIIYPTILENINLNSELISDETFGPVIPLIKFSDLDEAIKIINSTEFGLQSGVFTNDIRLIEKLYEELEVGALAVNDGPGFRAEHFPFGGVKNSGQGREGVRFAMEEMSILKTLIM